MVKLYYGDYINGAEGTLTSETFNEVEYTDYEITEVNELRDVSGESIRNILYVTRVVEFVIGTDEVYSKYDFLKNFWKASLTKIDVDSVTKTCKIVGKGALPIEAKDLKKELKIKVEVY